ncbi:hypothetical protein J3L16_08130 [Alteromonas sp. 5E99-2]|uniref:hypothetical protein n=1 Tax=Alteromonas sp. 5E99-2 TaxID=2817683 RepID=UPI001A983FE0|nr:hypothetical protein [Alteromonas sp. 5E99-2]MBO1255649.1 hypothetical protein [Alteromonas sp. 5E99-2]
MKIKPNLLGIALAGVFTLSTAHATINKEFDLADATTASSVIVAGEVMSTKVDTSGNGTQTLVSVQVTDALKGKASGIITIALPGGSYSSNGFRVGETYAGVPQAFVNQKNMYFLSDSDTDGVYQVVGFNQGILTIESNDNKEMVKGMLTHGEAVSMKEMKTRIDSEGEL